MDYSFKEEFINILIENINNKGLKTVYNLDKNQKYRINNILEIVLNISKCSNSSYELPQNLSQYLHQPIYTRYRITKIRDIIKNQIILNNNIYNNYVIVGDDTPLLIKELTIKII